jgi:transposase
MNPREQRGLELAERAKIHRKGGGVWAVPSQSGRGRYWVRLNGSKQFCTCPDHEIRAAKCKHIFAVECVAKKEAESEKSPKPRVRSWPSYNAAQTDEKSKFVRLLSDLCWSVPEPVQANGRPRLPLSERVFACAYKIYVGFSARRFSTDLKEAQTRGLVKKTPHFNSINRYLSDPELTEVLKGLVTLSSLPLKAVETSFAVDSSGFSMCRFVRWFNKKYGRETDNREWVKAHLMCGVSTRVVTSVDISGWTANDTTYFVSLLERTAEHFSVREVSADKAYLSHKNLQAVSSVGGTAFVPFKSNTTPPPEDGSAWAQMYYFFMQNREKFLEHYHQRSNAETAFSQIKGKFGDSLRSKSDTGQINEALCKVLCHNLCVLVGAMHELGIEPAF